MSHICERSHVCRTQEWRAPPFYTDRDVEGSPRKGGGAAVLPSTVARGDASFRFYRRQRRINWAGSAVVALFCLALVFYVYVRVTRTLFGLGRFTGYGIFVLLVRARRLRACCRDGSWSMGFQVCMQRAVRPLCALILWSTRGSNWHYESCQGPAAKRQ